MNTGSNSRLLQFSFALCTLASVGPALGAGAQAAKDSGWYTQAQAASGEQLFNNYCAQCHRPDLTGAQGPALVGDAFLKVWSSRSLNDLVTFEHSKMPANNPGSLPDATLWPITAYILQKNGFAAGSIALGQPAVADRTLRP
jgi:mono/diheme cytochrome c family protein